MNIITTEVRVALPGHIPTANPRLTLGLPYEKSQRSAQQRRTDHFPSKELIETTESLADKGPASCQGQRRYSLHGPVSRFKRRVLFGAALNEDCLYHVHALMTTFQSANSDI